MSAERAAGRSTVVQVACLVAITSGVAAAVLAQRGVDVPEVRFHVLYVAQAAGAVSGVLLVLAAAASVRLDRGRLLVQTVGVLLVGLVLAGTYAYVTLPGQPGGRTTWRVGVGIYSAANGILAAFAVWLAGQPSLSAGGSPPDGGSA